MEGRDPGYDDWFDEPEPPSETQTGAYRGVYDDADDDWVLPEDEAEPRAPRELAVGSRTFTARQLAIVAASILALFFGILAAVGVFSGGKAAVPPVVTTKPPPPTTASTSTQPTKTPTVEAPSQTLKPGDTGSQVKVLQRALASLGFSPGKPDGDYGPTTQSAVERFQAAKKLAEDGIVGQQTLTALEQALSG